MTGQQLRNSILQEAIHGRLVSNVLQPGEKTGEELLKDILAERQKKENEEKGKKAKKLTLSTIEEEPWELPEGWCWCVLPDVASIEYGFPFDSTKFNTSGQGTPLIRIRDVVPGQTKTFTTEKASASYIIHSGDMLVGMDGNFNVSFWNAPDAYLNQRVCKITSNPLVAEQKFLYYYLPTAFKEIEEEVSFVTVKHLSDKLLKSLTIPLPPLSIQKKIISKIDVLFPLIDEYDKASVELETLNKILPDKLRKSVLQEAIHGTLVPNDIPEGEATGAELLQQILKERQEKEDKEKGKKAKKLTLSTIDEEPWELPEGWCWCKLGDIITLLSGRDLEPNKYNDTHIGIPYITGASNFEKGSIIINRWTPSPISISSKGDLLITCKGTVGALAFNTIGDIHIARQIMAISPFLINQEYLMDFLKSKVGDFNTQANGVIPGISREDILFADFPLPPLSIQKRIVKRIEEVFSSINELSTVTIQ